MLFRIKADQDVETFWDETICSMCVCGGEGEERALRVGGVNLRNRAETLPEGGARATEGRWTARGGAFVVIQSSGAKRGERASRGGEIGPSEVMGGEQKVSSGAVGGGVNIVY